VTTRWTSPVSYDTCSEPVEPDRAGHKLTLQRRHRCLAWRIAADKRRWANITYLSWDTWLCHGADAKTMGFIPSLRTRMAARAGKNAVPSLPSMPYYLPSCHIACYPCQLLAAAPCLLRYPLTAWHTYAFYLPCITRCPTPHAPHATPATLRWSNWRVITGTPYCNVPASLSAGRPRFLLMPSPYFLYRYRTRWTTLRTRSAKFHRRTCRQRTRTALPSPAPHLYGRHAPTLLQPAAPEPHAVTRSHPQPPDRGSRMAPV